MKLAISALTLLLIAGTAAAADTTDLKVCTYNIRMNSARDGEDVWPNRIDTVTQYLRRHDLVGLQEVTPKQFIELKERLTEFDSYGLGRDDGKHLGEAAAVFFRRNRLEPIETNTLWLAEDPQAVGAKSWDAAITRTMTRIVFRDKATEAKFLLINTHFDHVGKLARLNSAKQIAAVAKQDPSKLPVIVLGDFNCMPGSPPYEVLAGAFRDARLMVETDGSMPESTWNGFKAIESGRIIDHIFVNEDVEVNSFSIDDPRTPGGRFASDHLPVAMKVSLPNLDKPAAAGEPLGKLIWQDEFDGTELDRTKWKTEVNAFGGGNQELQLYTDRPKNARVKGGRLIIEAHRDQPNVMGTERRYSSARLSTKHRGDWKYGRIEVRAKLPKGQGLWPAIWMLPTDQVYGTWAASGEIDIMEMRGGQPDTVLGTLHHTATWPDNEHSGSETTLPAGTFADDFHVFGIDWREGEIAWFVDDDRYQMQTDWQSEGHAFPAPFDQRFHLVLNLAVGGGFVKPPNKQTIFPARMEVDYVRVYRHP